MDHGANINIRSLGQRLNSAIEKREIDSVLDMFTNDCAVTMFGIRLSGKDALRRGFMSLYDKLEEIRFEELTVMFEENTLFEEIRLHAVSARGEKVAIEAAEVLNIAGEKIQNMRFYLDRLQLASVVAEGILERKLLEAIERKSREGLE